MRSGEHGVELSPADERLSEAIAQSYASAGLEAPTFDQVLTAAGIASSQRAHSRTILQLLLDNGTLLRIQGEMFFHSGPIDHLKVLLREYAKDHEPERLIDVATFKDLAGVSRKYAIPLLEYLDSQRFTIRAGDKRIIAR